METKRVSGTHPAFLADLASATLRRHHVVPHIIPHTLAAMRRVEDVPSTASGALLAGDSDHPVGVILVESNRVCWTAADGLGRRLREILLSHVSPDVSAAAFDAVLARCRTARAPLCETLVDEGLLSGERMRAALKRHTLESLVAMDDRLGGADAGWPLAWVERGGRSFRPQFTFSPSEVLAGVGAMQATDETTSELVEDHLQSLAGTDCGAAAFIPDGAGDGPSFIGVLPRPWLLLDDLIELTAWAEAALAASSGFSPLVAHAVIRSAGAGGAAAWHYEGRMFAAACPSPESLGRLVTKLGNQDVLAVLSVNVAVVRRIRDRFGRSGFPSALTA